MKQPSDKKIDDGRTGEKRRSAATKSGRTNRHADRPPAHSDEDAKPQSQQEAMHVHEMPHIPFYENLGQLDFPRTAGDADDRTDAAPAAKLPAGEWKAGQVLLPPRPPEDPQNMIPPGNDRRNGKPRLTFITGDVTEDEADDREPN
jgi:hypothetical protein